MKVILHKDFSKRIKKLDSKIRRAYKARRGLFIIEQKHPLLDDHALQGTFAGCRSINITGDWRVVYVLHNKETAVFIHIDTHTNLYG